MSEASNNHELQSSSNVDDENVENIIQGIKNKHNELELLHRTNSKGDGVAEMYYESTPAIDDFVSNYEEVLGMRGSEAKHINELIRKLFHDQLNEEEEVELKKVIILYFNQTRH